MKMCLPIHCNTLEASSAKGHLVELKSTSTSAAIAGA